LATQLGWSPGERTLQRWFADDPQIAELISTGASTARMIVGFRPKQVGRCGSLDVWINQAAQELTMSSGCSG
jgi:hypothetical protein